MKKIAAILILSSFGLFTSLYAQGTLPPKPGDPGTTDGAHTIHGNDAVPVGTATALLVAMGAGVTAYKLRKSRKEE